VSDAISSHFDASLILLDRVARDGAFLAKVGAIAAAIGLCLKAGGKLLIVGNGGSAADAQHIAAELMGRYKKERDALCAVALTTDTSNLTAIANDYGFDKVFSRQVHGLGREGDVLLALSTSGKSPNVIAALDLARTMGMTTVLLTGAGGAEAPWDHVLAVPSADTAVIQQIHMVAAHAICGAVESTLAKPVIPIPTRKRSVNFLDKSLESG
jgi:D-sedoheptulose 7-phosphate isomerase